MSTAFSPLLTWAQSPLLASPAQLEAVLLVTGGSRGIGAATARLAAAQGWAVAVNYVADAAAAKAVVQTIIQHGGRAIAVQADVGKEADVCRLFATIDAELGAITGLVNNAGVVDVVARVDEMTVQRLTRQWQINVLGSFMCAREALRRMSTRYGGRGGAIVNVSSAAARIGSPNQYVDYAACKGAIDTFTCGLAREVAAEGVRVNAVRPGIVQTDIHASGGQPDKAERASASIPMQRAGCPDEIAQAIVWLLSPAASYTTGAIVDVSGGR